MVLETRQKARRVASAAAPRAATRIRAGAARDGTRAVCARLVASESNQHHRSRPLVHQPRRQHGTPPCVSHGSAGHGAQAVRVVGARGLSSFQRSRGAEFDVASAAAALRSVADLPRRDAVTLLALRTRAPPLYARTSAGAIRCRQGSVLAAPSKLSATSCSRAHSTMSSNSSSSWPSGPLLRRQTPCCSLRTASQLSADPRNQLTARSRLKVSLSAQPGVPQMTHTRQWRRGIRGCIARHALGSEHQSVLRWPQHV